MRPIIIGIGGAYSGSGKTTIASLILKRLKGKGLGAIKYTKTSLYCSIIDDIEVLSEQGKDTRRLLDSGAEKALWVQSPYDRLTETLQMAIENLSYLKGIIVEGNSVIEILKPDVVIFICGSEERFKEGAEKILGMADVVIFENEHPQRTPKSAKRFRKDNMEGFINFSLLPLLATSNSLLNHRL